MIFTSVLKTSLPVFLIIAIGYFFGFFKKMHLESIADLVLYLTSPCLAFTAMYGGNLSFNDFLILWSAFIFSAVGLFLVLFFLNKVVNQKFSWAYLPVIFMNSGHLGFPLALYFFGEKGLTLAIIMNTLNAILIYSVGVSLAKGKRNFWGFFELPYVYAVIFGIVFSVLEVKIPNFIYSPLLTIGNLTIPLMLLSLGQRLHDFRINYLGDSIVPSFLRIFGGFFLAIIFVNLFKITGLSRQIILLSLSLPSAIANYVLAEKFNFYPNQISTTVTFSNFLGIFLLPIIIWLIIVLKV